MTMAWQGRRRMRGFVEERVNAGKIGMIKLKPRVGNLEELDRVR